jgi:Fe-S-cluster containining protein
MIRGNTEAGIAAQQCGRCGTCCQKGGPAFHAEDRFLIDRGIIPAHHLYTIRKGEMVYDNVKGGRGPALTDIIKIKSREGSRTCFYFDPVERSCAIYTGRPLECRVLKCWDTAEIERVYAADRLTRADLLKGKTPLWDVIEDHHHRCGYEKMSGQIPALGNSDASPELQELGEMIHYDIHIRSLITEKGGIGSEMMDFLFGRPMTVTLAGFGLEVRRNKGRLSLRYTASAI